jgi:DNA polymerase (family 10)
MPVPLPSNDQIAALFDLIADHLTAKDENPFRVRSYRTAAASVRASNISVGKTVKEAGAAGLKGIPGVGERLAGLIEEYVKSGKVELLETLRKEVAPEELEKVRSTKKKHPAAGPSAPLIPVALILEIDAEYRERAASGELKMIAPKLLNPGKKAWLPILAVSRKGWRFTVMFSNTATAHKLGKTDDWVVVYYKNGKGENQCTVVTEQRGPLKGKRVIRGREGECRKFYGGD